MCKIGNEQFFKEVVVSKTIFLFILWIPVSNCGKLEIWWVKEDFQCFKKVADCYLYQADPISAGC